MEVGRLSSSPHAPPPPDTAAEHDSMDKRAPITVKFEIPYFTVSGIQVRYLKIVEKSGYQALPWVRYITQNGDDYRCVACFRLGGVGLTGTRAACGRRWRRGARRLYRCETRRLICCVLCLYVVTCDSLFARMGSLQEKTGTRTMCKVIRRTHRISPRDLESLDLGGIPGTRYDDAPMLNLIHLLSWPQLFAVIDLEQLL